MCFQCLTFHCKTNDIRKKYKIAVAVVIVWYAVTEILLKVVLNTIILTPNKFADTILLRISGKLLLSYFVLSLF
jgi:hypothetical protein